jgi:hypothetical protein
MAGTVNHRSFYDRVTFVSRETLFLSTILQRFDNPENSSIKLNIDPDYQRDHVWTDEQAEKFVGHLIEGGAVPIIIVNEGDLSGAYLDEVVDGKQRLTAAYRWMKGEIAAQLTDGRRVYLEDLDEESQRYITGLTGATMEIGYVRLSRAGVLRLYLRLNRGGTVHTDDEINHVRDLLAAEGE